MQNLMNYWNPWQEVNQIQREMNRMFGRRLDKPAGTEGYPPVNVWADDLSVVLTAELPGFDPDKIEITVNRNTIVLSGNRERPNPQEGETYFRKERTLTSFARSLELPIEVDPQSAEADYSKGVLTLRLARPAAHQPQKVIVKAV